MPERLIPFPVNCRRTSLSVLTNRLFLTAAPCAPGRPTATRADADLSQCDRVRSLVSAALRRFPHFCLARDIAFAVLNRQCQADNRQRIFCDPFELHAKRFDLCCEFGQRLSCGAWWRGPLQGLIKDFVLRYRALISDRASGGSPEQATICAHCLSVIPLPPIGRDANQEGLEFLSRYLDSQALKHTINYMTNFLIDYVE